MIIVSQDKDNIVNFSNIVSIGIEDFDLNENNYYQRITAETLGTAVVLGDYKTEERAKEVLEEITSAYTIIEIFKISIIDTDQTIPGEEIARNICYEMPKE